MAQKRKAQNRAAQRAFRDRKEKHLKDLEIKVEDLEKASETKNNENGLLRAQVERLQIELKEYRKRLSWISSSGQGGGSSLGSSAPGAAARTATNSNSNDFQFEFPRFGHLPANHLFNGSTSNNGTVNNPVRSATLPAKPSGFGVPGVVGRNSLPGSSPQRSPPNYASTGNSPLNATGASPPVRSTQTFTSDSSFDSLSGLFSPSILEASRQASIGYFPQNNANPSHQASQKAGQISPGTNVRQYSASSMSNTDSPASSYESQQNGSSIGTSPEPSLSSPGQRMTDYGLGTISEENQPQNIAGERSFCEQLAMACGDSKNPVPRMLSTSNGSVYSSGSGITPGLDPNSFNWFAQQNGGGFDPVLFGDFRESQDAIASQDFGAFFNDAFPLPELGSPEHNFNEVAPSPAKPDLMAQVEAVQEGKEEVVPAEDKLKMLTCNKIWFVTPLLSTFTQSDFTCRDRLQSMEQFRNGEIDIDNLCSDLRSKARCSEGGAVVHQKDLDNILGSAR
jgi:AP-1-like transcription factor